jgi:hypothetical protein
MVEIENLKSIVDSSTKEYNELEGYVTIEVSTHKSKIDRIFEYINQMEDKPINGYWVAFKCETCEEYHGNDFVHLSIEDDDFYLFEEDEFNQILNTTNPKWNK